MRILTGYTNQSKSNHYYRICVRCHFIACLGFVGLSAFAISQRIKESRAQSAWRQCERYYWDYYPKTF
jgi:hypothetical protein